MSISSTRRLMKYTTLTHERQISGDARQPILQEPDEQMVHLVRRLFLYRVPCMRYAEERGASDPAGEGAAESQRDPAVLLPPQHDGRSGDVIEPPLEGVEAKLSQGAEERSPVVRLGDGGVVLIHVGLRYFARIKVSGPEQTAGEPPPTERDRYPSEHRPPGHPKQERLTRAQADRADQDEPPYALWILDCHVSGDRSPHGVPHEHGIRKTQRIHEGDCQAGVSAVVVGGRRLVGETEATVVERDHAKACRG